MEKLSKKKSDALVAGISTGVLIFVYGLLLLIGGLRKAKGDTSIISIFGHWYEGLFLLMCAIFFVAAFVYRKNLFLSSAMFFAGLYTYLTTSSRLGGGIAYANNFGLIFIFVGLGSIISFIFQKPRNAYFLLYGIITLLAGITFVVSLTIKLYWIIPVGLVMAVGIAIAAWAIVRTKHIKSTEADNEKEEYTKNPSRKYSDYYKDEK